VPKPQLQILVCTNERAPETRKPSCLPRGSLEVYRRFKDRVRERGVRDRVMTVRTGCLKHCSQGITVCVCPHNGWYRAVTLDDIDEILDAALAGGEVGRLRMPDVPWE
jgi:(2Fe-2S) ferredoxin